MPWWSSSSGWAGRVAGLGSDRRRYLTARPAAEVFAEPGLPLPVLERGMRLERPGAERTRPAPDPPGQAVSVRVAPLSRSRSVTTTLSLLGHWRPLIATLPGAMCSLRSATARPRASTL